MKKLWHILIFRKNKKARSWVFPVLFRKRGEVRPFFHRVVYKKNGAIRPHFAYWIDILHEGAARSSDGGSHNDTSLGHPLSADELVLKNLKPLPKAVEAWKRRASRPIVLSSSEIVTYLQAHDDAPLILSVSHDNYREIPGGVQFCLQREENIARDRGMLYVQLHPWQPLPHLADRATADDYLVSINCDGTLIGTASMEAMIDAVSSVVGKGRKARVIIHHLLGHAPEAMARLVKAAGDSKPLFWLHDFFSLCPSVTLQRNTLKFCAAPPPNSNACFLCVFGSSRGDHLARMGAFFQATTPVVVAPSKITAQFWLSKAHLAHEGLVIVPHMVLREVGCGSTASNAEKVRIGYLGSAAAHKGWPTFIRLVYELSDANLEFVVLSNKRPNVGEDDWEDVRVTAEAPDAMVKAVSKLKLDFVLHWANCLETFSFTTFEAMAGGAYVLTNEISGNVRATVESTGRGAVFPNVQALLEFFKDGSAESLVQQRRKAVATTTLDIAHSDLSFSVPDWI